HNVNGETHPCGCRHFPLGGLPQVAGALEKFKKTEQVIYIDSGDTFFSTPVLPKNLEKSLTYNAKKLAKGLSDIGLKFWVPGDQDFAKGTEFINEIAKDNGITLILSNLKDKKAFEHKELILLESGPHKIFLVGIVHPSVLKNNYAPLFMSPSEGLKNVATKLKDKGYDSKNPFHRLVAISHSGITLDEQLAKEFPNIDWIVGAHTMNFLRFPLPEGDTKIVQVLSRNHYLGHITFSAKKDKTGDKYEIIEIRDELKDEIKPNPYLAWIDKHKSEMSKIQEEEQSTNLEKIIGTVKYATNNSCVDCHDAQNKFWQGTSHSIAYQTLLSANEQNNLACVKCHSLGLNEKRGFNKASDIVEFHPAAEAEDNTPEKRKEWREKYWNELQESFGTIKSVRKLKPEQRRKYASIWSKHDQKFKVNRNFSNVQCLNCHVQHNNHPFEKIEPAMSSAQKIQKMQDRCLECHDPDQSPEWYQKQSNGLPGAVDIDKLKGMMKKVACPKVAQ
ncbi:MAG: hypothetical protein NXH75_17560, partial [Halobacteriovoraceae bacterium]|nr:hypothetical protein [Halobacteriovoraceae bacterium]